MVQSVLITGTSGFLGGQLVSCLEESEQFRLTNIDRKNSFDLSVPGWVDKIPDTKIDVVVHLAQSNRYNEFPEGADDVFKVNLASTFDLLEWSRIHGVKRFIFASSGSVYKGGHGKMTEEAACLPRTIYSASKFSAEKIIETYAEFFEVVNVRIFGLYGPGQKNKLIANIIEYIKSGREITLADGKGIFLTPVFVKDAVDAFVRLIKMPLPGSKLVVNLAGDEVLSLADIVNSISEVVNETPVTKTTQDMSESFCGENSKIKKMFNIAKFTCFKEGVKASIK